MPSQSAPTAAIFADPKAMADADKSERSTLAPEDGGMAKGNAGKKSNRGL
jgi:hypothetical protein